MLLIFFPAEADAACVCRCVNGKTQPVCDSPVDLKPICARAHCPIPPRSKRPQLPATAPPLGATSCAMAQVLDPRTQRYEWQRICR